MADIHLSFSDLVNLVQQTLSAEAPVYLVGGCVRDLLRNEEPHDIDFVVIGDALPYARQVADQLEGAFFRLDDEHGGGRVLLPATVKPGQAQWVLDFTPIQCGSLEEDLASRDFTINAIALPLGKTDGLIDPLGGAQDLHARVLRACSPTSLADDPIRVLRSVRMVTQYRLKIEARTLQWIKDAVPGLETASVERIRDELFRMLGAAQPATAIRLLDQLGILSQVLPELTPLKGLEQPAPHIYDTWEHTLQVIGKTDLLFELLVTPGYDPEQASNFAAGLTVLRLGRFREKFAEHFSQPYVQSRSLRSLYVMAALYHDAGKPATQARDETGRIHFIGHETVSAEMCTARLTDLRLSNQEIKRVETIIQHHMRLHQLAQTGEGPSRRAIFRYFKDTQEAGVDLCLLNLADVMATYGHTLTHQDLQRYLDLHRILLEAYWEKPEEAVSPPRLVNGNDLMDRFGLKPGALIGELLRQIQEAQAAGEISDQEQALEFARERLASQG